MTVQSLDLELPPFLYLRATEYLRGPPASPCCAPRSPPLTTPPIPVPSETFHRVCEHILGPDADLTTLAPTLRDQVVLLRLDLNVPLANGGIADAHRLRATLPTLDLLLAYDARVVILSHSGRPCPIWSDKIDQNDPNHDHDHAHDRSTPRDDDASLALVAAALAALRPDKYAGFVPHITGPVVRSACSALCPGQFLVIENVRLHAGETSNSATFARTIREDTQASAYILDAFAVAHRAHTTTHALPLLFPRTHRFPGLLIRQEVHALSSLLLRPARPFCCVIGGAKVVDKIGILKTLVQTADCLMLGGRMSLTFLAAQGVHVGLSAAEQACVPLAQEIMRDAERTGVRIMCPTDLVLADGLHEGARVSTSPCTVSCCSADAPCVPRGMFAPDIGPETAKVYAGALGHCATILWNGPMGMFEVEAFARGTAAVRVAMASRKEHGVVTVVGGGDTGAAAQACADRFSHMSTGGGATLAFLEGQEMPALTVLCP